MKSYRNNRWAQFRTEIIALDGQACVECHKSADDGAILQVHHKKYIKGQLPWEYAPIDCETLCKACHATKHGEIRPLTGWNFLFQNDLGAPNGECECCGTTIRYAFFIQHQHWEPMSVGTVCCDNLTGTKQATDYRKMLERRARFVNSKRWSYTPQGIFIRQQNILIEIVPEESGYKILMNKVDGKKRFGSEKSAKERVFQVIDDGRAQRYLANRLRCYQ